MNMQNLLIPSILGLLILLAVPTNANFCRDLTDKCIFRFCNLATGKAGRIGRRFLMPAANLPKQEPLICRKRFSDNIGRITLSGEPLVITIDDPSTETPLRAWRPTGLSRRFARKFFYAGDSSRFPASTLYRKKFNGNQMVLINETCIRLPILAYEKRMKDGPPVVVMTQGRVKKDCVSFVPWPMYLDVQFEWDTKDDLDLKVTEPDGTVLSKNTETSPNTCGGFKSDRVSEKCFSSVPGGGTEFVNYRTCHPPAGKFIIRGEHFSNCGQGPTNWKVRVKRNGKIIFQDEGTSNGDFSSLIFSRTIMVR